jgi:hypothetical protein
MCGEGAWAREKAEALPRLRLRLGRRAEADTGEEARVGAAVFERGDGGSDDAGVIWWERKAWGEGQAERGVDMGVSGGVGAPEEGEEWEVATAGATHGVVLSRSSSSSIPSGSKADTVFTIGLNGICICGFCTSPFTSTMWTASKCSSSAWRSLRWRPQHV